MTKSTLLEKYPVHTLQIAKSETTFTSVDEFISYYKAKIEAHPIAVFIAEFDHYAHTSSIDGAIDENILSAKAVIFCFGSQIPNSKILAARPRSFAIVEHKDEFVVEFMEAPNEKLQLVMQEWTKEIVTK
jgi:hypothetical protein